MGDLSRLVLRKAKEAGGIRALGRSTGISAGYLSRLSRGEKLHPTDDVLSVLGIEKVINYRAAKCLTS